MIGAGPRRPRRRAPGEVSCPLSCWLASCRWRHRWRSANGRRVVWMPGWTGSVDLPAQSHDCRAAFRGMARAAILGDLLVLDRRSDPAFSLSPVPGNCGGGAVGLGQDWRAGRDGAGVLCPGARPLCSPACWGLLRLLTLRYFQPWTRPDQWESEQSRTPGWAMAIIRFTHPALATEIERERADRKTEARQDGGRGARRRRQPTRRRE